MIVWKCYGRGPRRGARRRVVVADVFKVVKRGSLRDWGGRFRGERVRNT